MIEVGSRSGLPGRPTRVKAASEVSHSSHHYASDFPEDNIDISVSTDSTPGDCTSSRVASVRSTESETEELTGREDTKYADVLRVLVVILNITACVSVPILVYAIMWRWK
jgi:hypothetical protein